MKELSDSPFQKQFLWQSWPSAARETGPERQVLSQGLPYQPAGDSNSSTGTLTAVRERWYNPRKKALPAPSHPQLRKSFSTQLQSKRLPTNIVRLAQPQHTVNLVPQWRSTRLLLSTYSPHCGGSPSGCHPRCTQWGDLASCPCTVHRWTSARWGDPSCASLSPGKHTSHPKVQNGTSPGKFCLQWYLYCSCPSRGQHSHPGSHLQAPQSTLKP